MVNGSTEISNILLINLNKTGCMLVSKDLHIHVMVQWMRLTAVKSRVTESHIWTNMAGKDRGLFCGVIPLVCKFCRKLWKPYHGTCIWSAFNPVCYRKRSKHNTAVLCLYLMLYESIHNKHDVYNFVTR
jgi:hypothetical protein